LFSLDLVTRYLLLTLIMAAHCAADTPRQYAGVVRRQGSGSPVAGVTVTAHVDPSWLDTHTGLATEKTIASTVTRADGHFELTLAAPRKRLWFQVLGMPKVIPEIGHSARILLQDGLLRRPRPEILNVIEVPATFRPRPKNFNFHDWPQKI
jgi:hypothetical protein